MKFPFKVLCFCTLHRAKEVSSCPVNVPCTSVKPPVHNNVFAVNDMVTWVAYRNGLLIFLFPSNRAQLTTDSSPSATAVSLKSTVV